MSAEQKNSCEVCTTADDPSCVFCEDCDVLMCRSCNELTHHQSGKRRHTRHELPRGTATGHYKKPSATLCDNCEEAQAAVWCREDQMAFCNQNACNEDWHRPTKLRNHKRVPLERSDWYDSRRWGEEPPAPTVEPTTVPPADRLAAPVGGADVVVAGPGPTPTPTASTVVSADPDVHWVTGAIPLCENCERTTASVRCEVEKTFFCSDCNRDWHSSSKMRAHPRKAVKAHAQPQGQHVEEENNLLPRAQDDVEEEDEYTPMEEEEEEEMKTEQGAKKARADPKEEETLYRERRQRSAHTNPLARAEVSPHLSLHKRHATMATAPSPGAKSAAVAAAAPAAGQRPGSKLKGKPAEGKSVTNALRARARGLWHDVRLTSRVDRELNTAMSALVPNWKGMDKTKRLQAKWEGMLSPRQVKLHTRWHSALQASQNSSQKPVDDGAPKKEEEEKGKLAIIENEPEQQAAEQQIATLRAELQETQSNLRELQQRMKEQRGNSGDRDRDSPRHSHRRGHRRERSGKHRHRRRRSARRNRRDAVSKDGSDGSSKSEDERSAGWISDGDTGIRTFLNGGFPQQRRRSLVQRQYRRRHHHRRHRDSQNRSASSDGSTDHSPQLSLASNLNDHHSFDLSAVGNGNHDHPQSHRTNRVLSSPAMSAVPTTPARSPNVHLFTRRKRSKDFTNSKTDDRDGMRLDDNVAAVAMDAQQASRVEGASELVTAELERELLEAQRALLQHKELQERQQAEHERERRKLWRQRERDRQWLRQQQGGQFGRGARGPSLARQRQLLRRRRRRLQRNGHTNSSEHGFWGATRSSLARSSPTRGWWMSGSRDGSPAQPFRRSAPPPGRSQPGATGRLVDSHHRPLSAAARHTAQKRKTAHEEEGKRSTGARWARTLDAHGLPASDRPASGKAEHVEKLLSRALFLCRAAQESSKQEREMREAVLPEQQQQQHQPSPVPLLVPPPTGRGRGDRLQQSMAAADSKQQQVDGEADEDAEVEGEDPGKGSTSSAFVFQTMQRLRQEAMKDAWSKMTTGSASTNGWQAAPTSQSQLLPVPTPPPQQMHPQGQLFFQPQFLPPGVQPTAPAPRQPRSEVRHTLADRHYLSHLSSALHPHPIVLAAAAASWNKPAELSERRQLTAHERRQFPHPFGFAAALSSSSSSRSLSSSSSSTASIRNPQAGFHAFATLPEKAVVARPVVSTEVTSGPAHQEESAREQKTEEEVEDDAIVNDSDRSLLVSASVATLFDENGVAQSAGEAGAGERAGGTLAAISEAPEDAELSEVEELSDAGQDAGPDQIAGNRRSDAPEQREQLNPDVTYPEPAVSNLFGGLAAEPDSASDDSAAGRSDSSDLSSGDDDFESD